ncbi:hypothetical protein ACS0TY_016733 [Phlomoides rotata]
MAAKDANEAIVYEEFEPFSKWQRNEDQEIIEIHLQDFKKEQLKVEISNHGILKVSGQRSLDASKHTKFYKEIPVPTTIYDTQSIHAKFVNNNLIITLPKLKPSIPEVKVPSSEPSKTDQTPPPESATGAPVSDIGGGVKDPIQAPIPKENAFQFGCWKRPTSMGLRVANVAVSLAATAAVVAVLVAYVVYMYKSTTIDD